MFPALLPHPALATLLAAAQARHGSGILTLGAPIAAPRGTPTGMPALDAITGYNGLPQGRITILRGHGTSGKMTLALAALTGLQRAHARPVCFIDISGACDMAALHARGLDTDALILARPQGASAAITLVSDLLKAHAVSAIFVAGLTELLMDAPVRGMFADVINHLAALTRQAGAHLIFTYDPTPPHTAHSAAFDTSAAMGMAGLVLACRATRAWLDDFGRLGLQISVQCTRSRLGTAGQASIDLEDV